MKIANVGKRSPKLLVLAYQYRSNDVTSWPAGVDVGGVDWSNRRLQLDILGLIKL